MGIFLHADDLGLTQGINAGIETCIKANRLHSVSVIPNGYAVEQASTILAANPSILASIHLNLVEGKALTPTQHPTVLTNKDGFLDKSFAHIWKKGLTLKGKARAKWVRAIRNELEAQLIKGIELLPAHAPVRIDGHQHIHMIPIVAEALFPLLSVYKVGYIRIPRERFFFPNHPSDIQIALGSNFLKINLINDLIHRVLPYYEQPGITLTSHFIGLLFTGKMNIRRLQSCFDKIKPDITALHHVEILFHPGKAAAQEIQYWEQQPKLWKYYHSEARNLEKEALLSDSMQQWIQTHLT